MKVPSEEKLIICLSRKVLDGEWTREARTLLGRDLNWRYVKRRADEGGVSGLLWRNLKLLRADSPIPSNILKAFKVSYCRNLMGYAASVEVLRDVLAGLTLADIPVLLLRGISLIKTVYGDEGLRDFSDVDLLLRGVDLPRTGEILRSLGFSSPREYPLLFCKDDLWLDLHLDLADTTRIRSRRLGARFDHEAIWKEATSIDVASSRVFILSPWDQIIFLSFHALKHSFWRLIWMVDIAEAVRSYEEVLDWDHLLKRAREFGLSRAVYYGLSYVREVLGAPVPAEVISALRPRHQGYMERRLLDLALANLGTDGLSELLYLFSIPGMAGRARFLWETIFPRAEIRPQLVGRGQHMTGVLFYPIRLFYVGVLARDLTLRFLQMRWSGRKAFP